jgi:hypothetical protein
VNTIPIAYDSMASTDRPSKFFGLEVSPDITKVNAASYFLGCMASVMFLVFLNASQVLPSVIETNQLPFVITGILGVKKIGDIVGTLGFADVSS